MSALIPGSLLTNHPSPRPRLHKWSRVVLSAMATIAVTSTLSAAPPTAELGCYEAARVSHHMRVDSCRSLPDSAERQACFADADRAKRLAKWTCIERFERER